MLLHEVLKTNDNEQVITWVYEQVSFVPTAKLIDNKSFSIVSDYIGRPIQVYDQDGDSVWSADYDIYGKLINLQGDKAFMPFRQLGQYEDVEIGLYYNRFRYYSPDTGGYISQDPIGLAGGLAFYGYVKDINKFVDIFGLDTFYQLFNDGNLIYEGITERNIQERLIEHIHNDKKFSKVRYVDDLENRIEARNMEGSSLFHNKSNKFQLNKRRIDEGFYHSYDPDKIKEGRKFLSVEEIEVRMQKGKTADVDSKGKMSNIKCH